MLERIQRLKVRVGRQTCSKTPLGDLIGQTFLRGIKKPRQDHLAGFSNKSLTMTYSHMGKPHTTIGDAAFHF